MSPGFLSQSGGPRSLQVAVRSRPRLASGVPRCPAAAEGGELEVGITVWADRVCRAHRAQAGLGPHA